MDGWVGVHGCSSVQRTRLISPEDDVEVIVVVALTDGSEHGLS